MSGRKNHTEGPKPEPNGCCNHNALDNLLSKIGKCGIFEIRNYFIIWLPIICSHLYSMSYLLTSNESVYRCNISQCDSLISNYSESWLSFTIPKKKGKWVSCEHFQSISQTGCNTCSFNATNTVPCESGYKFDGTDNMISREFELVCSESWKLDLVATVHHLGELLGLPLLGYLADRYGRKSILILSGFLSSLGGLAQSHAPEYYSFVFFEFMNMATSSILFPIAFVMVIEMATPTYRIWPVMTINVVTSITGMGLGYLASYILDWRIVLRVIYTPGLLHLLYICYLPESIRWLLSQSREEEAMPILWKMASMNGRPLCQSQVNHLVRENRRIMAQSGTYKGRYTIRQVFRALRGSVAQIGLLWFTTNLLLKGLVFILNDMDVDLYVNYSLISFMLFFGTLLATVLMNFFGVRRSLCILFGVPSVLLIVIIICDIERQTYSWYLIYVAQLAVFSSIVILLFYTTESFPTCCRISLFCFCAMVGSLGSILASQTILVMSYYKYAPHMIYAIFGTICSVLSIYLTETGKKSLPTTLEEACGWDKGKLTEYTI